MNRAERRRRKKPQKGVGRGHQAQDRPDQESLLQTAYEHHSSGRIAAASDIYSNILKSNPFHPDALHLSGLVALQKGQFQTAVRQIKKAVDLVPEYTEAICNLGLAYRALGRFTDALQCFLQALQINEGLGGAHNNAGLVLHDLREWRKALSSFEKAISINPDNAEPFFNKGNTHRELSESVLAIASYQKALKIDPQYADAQVNLAVVLQENGRIPEAVEIYRKVISNRPDNSAAYNNLGTIMRDSGNFEDALYNYQMAISINPTFEEAHLNLGLVFREIGQLENSRKSLETATDINSRFTEAHYQLGNTLSKLREPELAIASYNLALEIRSDYTDVYNAMGRELTELGRFEEAVTNFKRVLDLDPADEKFGARLMLAHIGAADAPARTPVSFLQDYYRRNINRWDRGSAKYLGHLMVEAAVSDNFKRNKQLSILDMGCGSGTLAEFLCPYARFLKGVDISSEMLQKATDKEVYDELVECDLVPYLGETSETFDLIISAAVLIHFGDLKTVFSSLKGALARGGQCIFTLFEGSRTTDYAVNSEGWFSHNPDYVARLIDDLQCQMKSMKTGIHEYKNNGNEIIANTYVMIKK